jgi:antitoxin ParD1/3/4
MATVRKNITFTEQLNDWVQTVLAQGEYANESEYIRDLIRHDRERRGKLVALQAAIQKGMESGVSNATVADIVQRTEERLREDGNL